MLIQLVISVSIGTLVNLEVLGEAGVALGEFSQMTPHLILLLFLPPLIFESAFAANYHLIMRELGQALILAFPCVVVAATTTGSLVYLTFGLSWSFSSSLMFGAAISATDPVAVVALLREIGASKRLATLIEAESLLNDGSAFVLFIIVGAIAAGHELTVGDIVSTFCRLVLGAGALGLAIGVPTVYMLSNTPPLKEVDCVVTIFVAYLTFWLAESSFAGIKY